MCGLCDALNARAEVVYRGVQLVKYSLKSFDPAEFDISPDSYLPIYGNFDLSFDMSASDLMPYTGDSRS